MSKPYAGIYSVFLVVAVLLTGCMNPTRSETIIIPDSGAAAASQGEQVQYDVKTIYRVLEKGEDHATLLGWIAPDSLIGLFLDPTKSINLERIDAPYESHLKLRKADVKQELIAISPDGQKFASVLPSTSSLSLILSSVSDAAGSTIRTFEPEQFRSIKLGWSNNGRYLVCLSFKLKSDKLDITVYDQTEQRLSSYSAAGWNTADPIASVRISDDGQSVAIVRLVDKRAYVVLGTWNGSDMIAQYEHLVTRDTQAEWIHNDQIAFLGQEGTLYAYDRRNGELSVLVEGVGMYRLSPDRKSIAYSQDKDTVFAAALYGNNVLNKTQLFKGIVPTRIEWSPDNGKLLLSGWKTYDWEPRAAPAQVSGPVPQVKEATGFEGQQNLVIDFK